MEKLESAAEAATSHKNEAAPMEPLPPLPTARDDKANGGGGEWDWHRIEMERLRGLRIAANWLSLDKDLSDEFQRG